MRALSGAAAKAWGRLGNRLGSAAVRAPLMSIARSLSWTFVSRIGGQVTAVLFSIFLARLLTPAEYGLIGMLTVLSGFATIVGEAGLNSALVYVEKADDDTYATAFWIQLAINLAFTALFFAGAGWIADFYASPALAPLTRLMSVVFVLQSVGQIQTAILSREMRFRAIAIVGYAATFLSCACGLLLAVLGWGAWALAWQSIATFAVQLVGTSIATRWRPRLRFSRRVAREMFGYGGYLLLNNGINYWLRNGDNLLIGRFLGAGPLGIYNRAYTLMLLPLQNIGAIVGQVMFPTLARLRDDADAFRALYVRCIRSIALVAFPLMGGLSVLAAPTILVLYGPQWTAAAPVLRILSLVGLFQCIIFPVGWIYTALGRTKEQFRVTLALVVPFVVLIGYGLRGGLLGVTWGYAVWAVISGFLNIHVAGRLIGVSTAQYLALAWRKAAATAAMMAAVSQLEAVLVARGVGIGGALVSCVLSGGVVYAGMLALLRDPDLFAAAARAANLAARRPSDVAATAR